MKINLIPEIKKEQQFIKKLNLIFTAIAIGVAAAVVTTILIFFTINLTHSNSIKKSNNSISDLNNQLKSYDQLEKTVLELESSIDGVKAILESDDKWTVVYENIEKATPNDIRLNNLSIDKTGSISVSVEGKDVVSVDRFIKSFSTYKEKSDATSPYFRDVLVDGYGKAEDGRVNFSARFSLTNFESTQ